MSSVLRKMMVVVGANISEFVGGMDKVDKRLLAQSRQLEKMGKDMTVGITLPLLAVGVASIKAATEYENANAIIRRQTGATGDTLVGLNQQFRNLFVSIPNSSKDTANALGMLQTRTGLVGEALEDLTRQHLNLSRITGEAVLPLIEQTTRVFGDWGIATDKQGAAMDYLYKVSQQTGVGVSRLGMLVVQYGAPVRQMGFSFEEAAAMLGKFEKEGVNTELVMGSLRIALGKMAKEGVTDTSEALRIVTQQIKEAGSTGEANALSLELFGARAGPDMAAAIREGRFDLDALLTSLRESPETIAKASAETLTFADKMAILRNKAIDAAQPLGNILLKALEAGLPLLEGVAKAAGAVGRGFAALPAPVSDFTVGLGLAVAAFGPALVGIAKMQQALIGLKTTLKAMETSTVFGLIAAGIVLVGTMIVRENQRVKEAVDARAKEIEERIGAQIAEEKRLALESVETEKKAAQDKIAAASATTRAKLEGLEEEKAAHKAALEDRKREIEDEHKAAIDGIRREYGYVEDFHESKTDAARRTSKAVIDSLEAEAQKARDTHSERIEQLNAVYAAKLLMLDEQTRTALEAVQDEIDGIDAQTRAEEKELAKQRDQRRVSELQARIATEEDVDRRAELQQQLADLLAEIHRKQLLEAREAEKDTLRERMAEIRRDAEDHKTVLQEELKELQQAEDDKLKATLGRIADSKTAEETALAEAITRIQTERKEKEAAENAKYLAAKESNEKQLKGLDDYHIAYKAKLEREVIAKESAERDKLQATLTRLADEEKAINASFAERERAAAANAAAMAKAEIVTIPAAAAAATTQFYTQAGTLPGDIAPPVWGDVPFYGDEFETGGTVPGPRGMPRMAVVHGGEEITSAGQARRGAGDVHLHYHGPVYGAFDFERSVKEIVRGAVRSGAFRGVIPEVR